MGDKIVGIIGGMGPEATVDLMERVIRATPAQDDVDHIRLIVDNNPKIPSRIKAIIEGSGESPVPCLQEMARSLAAYGADFLAMPCNTAHCYYEEIRSAAGIPVLNMIDLTVETVLRKNPLLKCVGLLTSRAVILTEIYLRPFKRLGVEVMVPSAEIQDRLMQSIKIIKTGRYGVKERSVLKEAAQELTRKGSEALVIACTELSIIAEAIRVPVKVFDSAQILAEAIVRRAKQRE